MKKRFIIFIILLYIVIKYKEVIIYSIYIFIENDIRIECKWMIYFLIK